MLVCGLHMALSTRWSLYEEQVPGPIDSPAHQGDFVIDVLEQIRVHEIRIRRQGLETVAEGVLNIIRQGADGPTGKSYLVGPSQSAMSPGGTTGPADVARILQATA